MYMTRGSKGWIIEMSDRELNTNLKLINDAKLTDEEEDLLDKMGKIMHGMRERDKRTRREEKEEKKQVISEGH